MKALDTGAARVKPGCDGLVFWPYLAGERTPHMNPNIRGAFFGLSLDHDRFSMVRAVMEGVAFALMDAMDVLTALGLKVDQMVMAGGGARSALWKQIITDVFERPIRTSAMREEAGVGAAICAMVAVGARQSLCEACDSVVCYEPISTVPNPRNFERYRDAMARFRALYPADAMR